ncbi:MAG TPA: hypothetical protein VNO84_00315 [Burkholderiaceae bacterium]|nr:hypothetical protein [Burkholderiaceae bacterium]
MKKTYVDVLLALPPDETLHQFLASHGLAVPPAPEPQPDGPPNRDVIEAIKAWGDTAARDRLTAELMASVALGDAAGGQAMLEATVNDPAVLTGLTLCQSDLHRSFWLYVRHRALFERASDLDFWAHHSAQAQQFDLGVRRRPIATDAALAGLRQAISAYYQRERQCGEGCVAYLVTRSPGIHLLTVHVKDLAMLRLEFEGVVLKQRVGNPNIHMVLEYAEATGVVRTLVRGGHKVQQMLVQAFAEHVLGVQATPERIKAPALDLSALRMGFDVPEVLEDGFSLVQLKSLALLSPDGELKIECTAMQASRHRSVHELLREQLPAPLEGRWTVLAAQINLYYPPEPGRTRARVVPIEVTSRGRLNLHQFDPRLQAQLERYLVRIGILRPGQTLSAHEAPLATGTVGAATPEDA